MANSSFEKTPKIHMVQILNDSKKDSLIILTTSRLHALSYYIYTKLSTNWNMTPLQVKNVIEDFRQDPKNLDLAHLSIDEIIARMKAVDKDENWHEVLNNVQELYQNNKL